MDEINVTPVCSFKDFQTNIGSYYHNTSRIVDTEMDIHIIDSSTSMTLCILRKNTLPFKMIDTTVDEYLPIAKKVTSSNRGSASGNVQPITTKGKRSKSNPVHSMIAGYIDSPNNKYPCRLTQFSSKYYEVYCKSLPFIKHVDKVFEDTLPVKYANQREYANKTKYVIDNTVFTTVTVNYNFQTALHVDKGDCIDGFGVLVVSSKNIEGGYLLFPRFDIGVFVRNTDILFLNVHEYHCNSKITYLNTDAYRLSFVFYLRTRLLDCQQNNMFKELGIEDGKYWDTNILVLDILKKIGDSTFQPSATLHTWSVSTTEYTFLHKNRQYKLYDKTRMKHIINLQKIWNYLHSLTI